MADELILVVEDDASIAVVIDETLRDLLGVRTAVSPDGEQALRMVWGEHPALVLLDLALPGLDGLEIARTIKSHPATRDIRVIVFTGLGVARHRAMEAGCDDFLEKPLDLDHLLGKVREQLTARTLERV